MLTSILLAAALSSAPKDDAIRLYDEAKYADAEGVLKTLDAGGTLDGPLLYRLFFCERTLGNEAAAQQALDRARRALEAVPADKRTLEDSFYLANTYSNMGRAGDAQAVAGAATKKIESGVAGVPKAGIELFQIGKLYQDQGRQDDAVRWYQRAVDAFTSGGPRYANNVRWALRYVGNAAFAKTDFAAAEKAYDRLTKTGTVPAADWNALGAARARLGRYAEAADAWRTSVNLDAENADDPRYSARLADAAVKLSPLPAAGPDGKKFATMSKDDLEAGMKSRADAAKAVHVKAAEAMAVGPDGLPTRPLETRVRLQLQSELDAIRGHFVAYALEYALRRLPIRETAFREGYAVLVFQDREWELLEDPKS